MPLSWNHCLVPRRLGVLHISHGETRRVDREGLPLLPLDNERLAERATETVESHRALERLEGAPVNLANERGVVERMDLANSLLEDLADRLTQAQVKNLRSQLVDRIAAALVVDDPMLAKQYEAKKTQSDTAVHGKKDVMDAIRRDERRAIAPDGSPGSAGK